MDVSEKNENSKNNHAGFLWLATIIVTMGSLLFGYDTGVVNGSLEFMAQKGQLNLTAFQQGIVSSGLTLGAAFGAIIGGPLADKIGRKKILTILGIIFAVGALGCAFATNISVLIGFRFILGLAVGSASANVPVYIAEVAPTELRGKMVTTAQVMIVTGQFVAFGVNAALTPLGAQNAAIWRWMLGLGTIPGIILWLGMYLIPESPRWLVSQGKMDKALGVLRKIRAAASVDSELEDIKEKDRADKEQNAEQATFKELVSKRWVVQILITGSMLGIIQQFAGINSIMYYGGKIIQESGFNTTVAAILNAGNGFLSIVGAVLGMFTIDWLGRRKLEFAGLTICGITLVTAGVIHSTAPDASWAGITIVILVYLYIIFFQGTLGPVTWLINSEIFPQRYRGIGTGITIFVLWIGNFVVGLLSPVLIEWNMSNTFYIFAACCVLGIIFVALRVPETKGVPLEDVEKYFRNKYDR
ncbi:sugar porter family MFS transporter [Lactiplantibacillus modestisalitolerans]|uniref:Sugar porter family MFS transporter n=1 Tax=Lactiplantibacillus modestisalitolerans TaxID=1457219 RepID=A0ABV5WTP0_9LACO|nr:sugar porter family MFS transporter [Lactiplantibacillus modestisalitolerans]